MSLTLLFLFLLLCALGCPLAIALGLSSVASIVIFTSTPVHVLSESMFSAMNSFLLVVDPGGRRFLLGGWRGRALEDDTENL